MCVFVIQNFDTDHTKDVKIGNYFYISEVDISAIDMANG